MTRRETDDAVKIGCFSHNVRSLSRVFFYINRFRVLYVHAPSTPRRPIATWTDGSTPVNTPNDGS